MKIQIDIRLKWDLYVWKIQKKNDKTIHDFHKNVDVYIKCHFPQDLNVIHIRDSLSSHLWSNDLIYIQNKKNEDH